MDDPWKRATNGRSMNESGVLCLLYTNSNRTARALSTTRYVLRLLHTNFFTNKQPARTGTYIHLRYPYDTRTIPVRFTYDSRTIPVRFTYDTRTIHVRSDRIGSDQIIRFGLTQVRTMSGMETVTWKKAKGKKRTTPGIPTWSPTVVLTRPEHA
jgi:hypothetical protein